MKSVIGAAALLVLSVVLCVYLSSETCRRIDTLSSMAEKLPTQTAFYEADAQPQAAVDAIAEYWAEAVCYFSYVCGYNILNRADEAVWNLYAAMEAGDYAAAIMARYQMLDALRRMRELEEISLSSVF